MSVRPAARPTAWWLGALRRRAARVRQETLALGAPPRWTSEEERRAAVKFFNAAFRAEESGLRQAHELAQEIGAGDAALGEVLRLYGEEEGWHRELITRFLEHVGGGVEPMGRVTRLLYRLYGRARRPETIVLANLMFETIGATTYRMALRNARSPDVRQMLTILTRDESFHVPLNVHFLRQVLGDRSRTASSGPPKAAAAIMRLRLRVVHRLLFLTLLALPLFSRPKAYAFDGIRVLPLVRGYARALGGLFEREPDLGLSPPWLLLALLGVRRRDLGHADVAATSVEAAEHALDRDQVAVSAL